MICTFDINGTIISGCNGITITPISNNLTFGYGYFIGEGSLTFNIAIDVNESELTLGNNKIYLSAQTASGPVSSSKENAVIKPATPANGENLPVEKTKGHNK